MSPTKGNKWFVYEFDPLTCPRCQGRMKILAFIEYEEVIKKILKHLFLTIICIATRIIPRKAGLRLMNRVDPRS